jgi:hypothetical protein
LAAERAKRAGKQIKKGLHIWHNSEKRRWLDFWRHSGGRYYPALVGFILLLLSFSPASIGHRPPAYDRLLSNQQPWADNLCGTFSCFVYGVSPLRVDALS